MKGAVDLIKHHSECWFYFSFCCSSREAFLLIQQSFRHFERHTNVAESNGNGWRQRANQNVTYNNWIIYLIMLRLWRNAERKVFFAFKLDKVFRWKFRLFRVWWGFGWGGRNGAEHKKLSRIFCFFFVSLVNFMYSKRVRFSISGGNRTTTWDEIWSEKLNSTFLACECSTPVRYRSGRSLILANISRFSRQLSGAHSVW